MEAEELLEQQEEVFYEGSNVKAFNEYNDVHNMSFEEKLAHVCSFYNSSQLMAHNLTDQCTANQVHLPKSFMIFVQVFYALVCVLGLCGNTLVIYVVLRYSKMQTVTYIYILMLAVADEIFLLGLPFLIVTLSQKSWIFGLPMCKIYMTTTSINQVRSYTDTVWKFYNFSATQFLREINSDWFQKVKNCPFNNLEALNVDFLVISHLKMS